MKKRESFQTGDQALVRQINLSLVMHILRTRAPLSRAALSLASGLNKVTVSDLVGELIKRQFVRELGMHSSGMGRPATLLALNPAAGFIVGCEIGVDFIEVIVTDFAPEVIWKIKEQTSPDMGQRAILDRTLALLHQGIENGEGTGSPLLGVAVGVPGMVDHATGTLRFAPNLKWHDVPLKAILEEARFGAPVFVDNEANMAALGEHYFGAAQGHSEVLYISGNVGLGGGIVRDSRLCRGANGVAAEFGHMTMDPDGEICNCGNRGCWETLVSQNALFRNIRRAIEQGSVSTLAGRLDQLSVPLVVEAAEGGDLVARQVLEKMAHSLGVGIASLLNALNPELVVFGGVLSLASDFLLPIVDEEIQKRTLRWNRESVALVRAAHGSDACAKGGVATVYQTVLSQANPVGVWTG